VKRTRFAWLRFGASIFVAGVLLEHTVQSVSQHQWTNTAIFLVGCLCSLAAGLMAISTNPRWHSWSAWRRKPR
jgi:uncharacterized membrane protein YidH (DUF202 family)